MKKHYTNWLIRKMLPLALTSGFLWLQAPQVATAQHHLLYKDRISVLQNNPAQAGQRVAATISLPGNSDNYAKVSGSWLLGSHSTYRYNLAGKLLSRLSISVAPSQVSMWKDSLDYDSHGQIIFKAHYQYYNNAWNTSSGMKYLTTYNSSGQLTEIITQGHTSGIWSNIRREVTTYHTNGSPLEVTIYNWLNNAWQPDGKRIYSYGSANNALTEILGQQYQNNAWVNESRISNLIWHNYARSEPLSFNTDVWLNNGWANYYKTIISYDAFGGYVSTWQEWLNNNWENDQRTSVSYDNNLNFIRDKFEIWQNNNWVLNQDNQEILTYNANNDVTERIYRDWDNFTNGYSENSKSVYSNFRYISGINKEIPQLKVNLYPNPTSEALHLKLEGKYPVTLQLMDLTGRVVLNQNLALSVNPKISLSALANGIYILKLESTEGIFTSKVIKQ